jgi:hypothetical protein
MHFNWSETRNVVVESLTLLLRILEILASNLGPETGYPEFFSWFYSVPQADAGIVSHNYTTTASFQISNSCITLLFDAV